ncbi:MAG: vitamin K epoxide reductase family protein [Actinomycetaceae bacterium]|nr:vitamin K epoxide reductase family protein [Actinomycetaceae bacterium]
MESERPEELSEVEQLSEAELDRRIARYAALPTDEQRRGGAPRELAFVMTITGLVGMFASLMLIMSEKERLSDPSAHLLCDINPLLGCGTWIGAWQNEVFFGVSNSVLGLAFFAGITGLGLVLLARGRFDFWLWKLATLGASLGIMWIVWFGYQSYVVEGSLCPYCVVTWLATIPLFVHLLARTMQAGAWGSGAEKAGSALVRNRWIIIVLVYVVLVAFTVIWFWDKWALVF